ncbi:MAG: integrase [Bacteroidota bacterium]
MNAEIYSALIDAGATEDKAKDAAKSVADYQNDINEVKADLKLIKWGIGLIIAAEVLPILKTIFA